jgi:hypothetical protein
VLEIQSTPSNFLEQKHIADVGLTRERCPLRQNHVIIHGEIGLSPFASRTEKEFIVELVK